MRAPTFRFISNLIFIVILANLSLLESFKVFSKVQTRFSTSILSKAIHTVTFQKDGKEFATIKVPENKTVLDAAIDAGVDIPYDCKLGVCLTCPSKVLSGKSEQDIDPVSTLESSVIEQGFALNCCLYARSDLVIDLIDEDTLINAQFVKGAKTTY